MKPCVKCGATDRYPPKEGSQIGDCRPCKKLYATNHKTEISFKQKVYYADHREELIFYHKDYNANHKIEISFYQKNYYADHKEEKAFYQRNRRNKDPNFKLARNLRIRTSRAIRNNQKSGSAVNDLGCSIPELKQHLETLFLPNMSWDNWSPKGWHIDHILPLSKFDLTDREQFLTACHYTNLQPLWAKDNFAKGAK